MSKNMWRTNGVLNFPVDKLILFAPLGHSQLSGASIKAWDVANGGVHTGTVTGAVHVPPTHRTFDLVDDTIKFTDVPFQPLGFSMSFGIWFKLSSLAGNRGLISKGNVTVSKRGSYHFYITASGDFIAYYQSSVAKTFQTNLSATTWYLFFMVCDHSDDSITVYKDGAIVGSPSSDTWIEDTVETSPLEIGNSALANQELGGDAGHVWVYRDKAMSAREVAHIHRATKWRYV